MEKGIGYHDIHAALNALLKGMAHGYANRYGLMVLECVFPSKVPYEFFGPETKFFERITEKAISTDKERQINEKLNSIVEFSKTYRQWKLDDAPREELEGFLETWVVKVVDVIADLQKEDIAETALEPFMIAASVHLLVLQELALVVTIDSPRVLSGHVSDIKSYAVTYAEYIEKKFKWIQDKRVESANVTQAEVVTRASPTKVSTVGWIDKISGHKYLRDTLCPDEEMPKAGSSRTQYVTSIARKLAEKLHNPIYNVAYRWRTLVNRPLPEYDYAVRRAHAK